jgi:hypothetical protein
MQLLKNLNKFFSILLDNVLSKDTLLFCSCQALHDIWINKSVKAFPNTDVEGLAEVESQKRSQTYIIEDKEIASPTYFIKSCTL